MIRLADNPPILFPGDVLGRRDRYPWHVAHTKARVEKSFAKELHRLGIGYFLPMIHRQRISGGRKRDTLLPLFPGYVFFRGSSDQRLLALQTNRLCQVIDVADQQQLLSELESLHRVLTSDVPVDWHPFASLGKQCRISQGPLQGLCGTVIQRHNASPRLVLQVSILGQGAAVDIDADALEPA